MPKRTIISGAIMFLSIAWPRLLHSSSMHIPDRGSRKQTCDDDQNAITKKLLLWRGFLGCRIAGEPGWLAKNILLCGNGIQERRLRTQARHRIPKKQRIRVRIAQTHCVAFTTQLGKYLTSSHEPLHQRWPFLARNYRE
jgi:hypothetical protein